MPFAAVSTLGAVCTSARFLLALAWWVEAGEVHGQLQRGHVRHEWKTDIADIFLNCLKSALWNVSAYGSLLSRLWNVKMFSMANVCVWVICISERSPLKKPCSIRGAPKRIQNMY